MSRSLKKGPFIDVKLEKRVLAMNETNKKSVVKTWARHSMISPDFVGHTVAVHNGNKFIPVYITENMVGHKLRYVVDLVRGMEVNRALGTLKFCAKAASADVEKLLRSAIANWEQKNDRKAEDGELYISKIFVNEGATLKRMRPAPQGRGYRIRKRSNHITLFVDTKND